MSSALLSQKQIFSDSRILGKNTQVFFYAVQKGWGKNVRNQRDTASILAGKLKNVRYELKIWSKSLSNLNILISNCNKVILFLDTLEELRHPFLPEFNLRAAVKEHLAKLLRSKNVYWRKRYTVNRIKFGDECTKFFHAMATVSYRKNTISQLLNEDGVMISDHEGKAGLLWSAYKNRMGISLNPYEI